MFIIRHTNNTNFVISSSFYIFPLYTSTMSYDKSISCNPWTVAVFLTFILCRYLQELLFIQYGIQILVSYSTSSGISSESMVLSNYSLNVFNETNEHLFTKRLITTSHYKDIPITSVQLKDFGKYTRNRKCLFYYCYL